MVDDRQHDAEVAASRAWSMAAESMMPLANFVHVAEVGRRIHLGQYSGPRWSSAPLDRSCPWSSTFVQSRLLHQVGTRSPAENIPHDLRVAEGERKHCNQNSAEDDDEPQRGFFQQMTLPVAATNSVSTHQTTTTFSTAMSMGVPLLALSEFGSGAGFVVR
ncbi:hypothetical protein [Amycolatopsis vastitatis]|nr:hypothetical protein [Amycolatopsis vastitatis]